LGRFLDGDFAALQLFKNLRPSGRRRLVAEENIHQIEPFDDRRVGNTELLFDVPDLSLAAEKREDERLKIRRQSKKRRNGELRFDRCIALATA
jgi:hypothetical protein